MKKLIVGLFLVLALCHIGLAGHIYTWDVDLFYQNEKNAQTITLFFSLESGLARGHFIRVKFPDSSTSVSGASVSPVGQTASAGSASVSSTTGGDVFVSVGAEIPANTWYQLVLSFDSTWIPNQTSGYKGVIYVETASGSSAETNRIVYDSNSVAGVYQLAPRPTETLGFVVTYPSTVTNTQKTTLSSTYDVFFDLKPQVPIKGGTKLRVVLDTTFWKLGSSCAGADQTCADGAAGCENITLVQGSCTVGTGNSFLELVATSDIVKDQTARIKTTVTNPSAKRSSAGVTAWSISKVANLIFEKKSLTGTFNVDGITPGKPVVKYLWGVQAFGSGKTLCPLGFYRKAGNSQSTGDSAKVDVFNDLILEFTVPTTPAGQNLELSFALPASNYVVIPGSVRTDLPVFSGLTQTITVSQGSSITVRHVAPLSSSSTYKLLAKLSVANVETSGAKTSFAITLRTVHASADSPPTYSTIDLGTGTAGDYNVVLNYEYLDWGTNAGDGIHRAGSAATTNPIGFGSVFAKTDATLTINTHPTDHTSNIATFLKNLYYGSGATSLTGYSGVGLGATAVQELILLVSPSLSQLCCVTGANCETNSNNAACIATQPASNVWGPSIALHIVANSNILNLDNTADTRNGVFTHGGFWGGCQILESNTLSASQQACYSNGRGVASPTGADQLSVLKNQWDFSESGTAYLQATCIPTASNTISPCVTRVTNTAGTSAVTTPSALGIRMKSGETSIFKSSQDKVSQLYGGQQVTDLIVCLGYNQIADSAARPTADITYTRASQSLLNVFIINFGTQVDNLRVRLFNYLKQSSSNDIYKAPIFLRVSGYIATGSFSALNVFIDANLGISKAKQCASTASAFSCVPFASTAAETGNPIVRSRVDVITTLGSGSAAAVEFFIPVDPSNADPNPTFFVDIGLSAVEENYISLKEIHRIYGYLWGVHSAAKLYTSFDSPSWAATAYAATRDNTISGGSCADASTGLPTGQALFYPGNSFESITLVAGLGATTCFGNNNGNVLKGGSGFTAAHYSENHDFLGSGSAKWADTIVCPKFTIDYSTKSNGFVCGLVGSSGSSDAIPASNNVILRNFVVPWTWGLSYSSPLTAYGFSAGDLGQLRAFKLQGDLPNTAYQRSCTTSDWGTVYKSSSLQRLSFTFSPSTGIDLTFSSFTFLATFATNTLDGFSIGGCSITLSAGTGTCSGSDTSTSQKTITVSRNSPRTASLAKGTQTVVLTVSQTSGAWSSSATSISYTAVIKNGGTVTVDSCETSKAITYSASDDTPVLSLGVPILQTSKASRTSFSFTFSVGPTSRQIWAGTKFDFILGWLGDNLAGVAANLHCFIRSGTGVSFGFRSLDLTAPATPSLVALNDLQVGSWTYVCNGARAPALSSSTKLTFAWKSSSLTLATIAEDNANAVAAVALTDAQAVLEASLKSKLWSTPGVEASYTFLFKPKRANYTLEGRVYVDFSIDIPPRGNEAGLPACEINSTRVYCEWAQERRLVVWPVIPLTSLTTQTQFSYELAVHGIAQPTLLGSFKSIGITLDLDSNPNNGVSEWAEVTDTSPSTAAITPLLVSEFANSNSVTRSNTEIKVNLNIPKDTIVKDARVYFELPPYFGDSLWLISSVTCTLSRISDLTNTNLVQNCSLLRNRRVKIFTNLDSGSNVDNIYVLTIGGIPTPAQPTLNAPNWPTVFLASSDEVTITHRTAPGYINATHAVYNHEANKQVPDWFVRTNQGIARVAGDLEVTIGTYRSDVVLRSPTVADVSYNYALGGEYISNLAIFPSNLKVVFGEPDSRFRIGAKANAIQGRYLVTSSKSAEQNANKQIPIPTLPILVRNNTCTVQANNENIKVPAGGWSLPIIFDFAECMPVTDVQVDANFTDMDKYNISFGPEVSNTMASEKLVFESWNNTRVSFMVRSFNASQKAGLKTKISFSLSGTNKDSYGAPRAVNVELVDNAAYNVAPTVTTFSASASAGQVTLNLACSATGNIYFAIGTHPDIQSRSVGDIKNSTYSKKLSLTPRDPMDAWWRVNGFVSQPGTTAVSVVLPGVKSAALYYGVAYCQNQMEIPSSNNLKTSWNQTDNGGRIAKATIVFNATLTQDQQKDIACALANLLKVPQNTVQTQDGIFCSTLRRLQSSNSSNSSNTTTNSTPTVQQNVSYSWFVLPDYAGVQSTVHTNLQSQMVAGFTDKLFALTTGKANTFPMVRSFSFFAPSSAVAAMPSTNEINPTINIFETYVTFDITLSNSSGYLYWGIGSNSSSRPLGRILRDKNDANGVALVAADRKYVPAKTLVSFNATSALVRNDTDYKLYIALSSDDPGPEAVFSDVVEKAFRTKKPNFSGRTLFGSLLVGVLLLISVFVL